MHPGLIGGILGGLLGVFGGIIGTYCSIKNTKGPKERSFMVKASISFWIFGILFVSLLFALPSPYKFFLWLPYGVLMPMSIHAMNKKLGRIRLEESP